MDIATLVHGSGGINVALFVQKIFIPYANEDCGIFSSTKDMKHVTSTDSYTINPIFFAGGNIGKLCVCGSSNDVAMMGGKLLYLNIGSFNSKSINIMATCNLQNIWGANPYLYAVANRGCVTLL